PGDGPQRPDGPGRRRSRALHDAGGRTPRQSSRMVGSEMDAGPGDAEDRGGRRIIVMKRRGPVKSIVMSALVAAVMSSTAGAAWAADGVLIVQQTTTAGGPKTNQVQIAKDKMRAEVSGTTGATQIVIFDATKQVIDMVNFDRKTYTEMTKADLDNMAAMAQQ